MNKQPTKLLDAVHAEMLTEILQISKSLEKTTEAVNEHRINLDKQIESSKKHFDDLFAKFTGLAGALNEKIGKEKEAHASSINRALAPFTKYFWLLITLSVFTNVIALSAIIVLLLKY